MTDTIHSCSYYCHIPACIKAQRDELRDKLYQRTWVGLTDEERMELYKQFTDSDEWTYEKAIEAKLKEKNT